ncbi:acyl carrier protein phosphodiesterase [Anopheles sinensis]|uniref:Acyl carrier protein phosphodiesterase n=1 Tax=Anopheles sinensis TaxID=74873 RepID=A0A084VCT3_ANOSI|nr:acyl carrier protein phosphodiesterase [Anopheles sinensis]
MARVGLKRGAKRTQLSTTSTAGEDGTDSGRALPVPVPVLIGRNLICVLKNQRRTDHRPSAPSHVYIAESSFRRKGTGFLAPSVEL